MLEMRRVRMLGVCLAAVFAICGLVAASAMAVERQRTLWRTCEKAPKQFGHRTGEFTEAGCATVSETHEGGYEMKPFALSGESVSLKGKGGKAVFYVYDPTLENGYASEHYSAGIIWKIECAQSKSVGEADSPHKGSMQVTFKKCTGAPQPGGTSVRCSSAAGKGTIETALPTYINSNSWIPTYLYYGKAQLEIGGEYTQNERAAYATVECGSTKFELVGGLGAPVIETPALNGACSTTLNLGFYVSLGEPGYEGVPLPWGAVGDYGTRLAEPLALINGEPFNVSEVEDEPYGAGLETTETLKSKTPLCVVNKEPET
jgi:hypothetical protein